MYVLCIICMYICMYEWIKAETHLFVCYASISCCLLLIDILIYCSLLFSAFCLICTSRPGGHRMTYGLPTSPQTLYYVTGVGSGGWGWGARRISAPPLFWLGGGGAIVCLCPPPPPLLTPHFYFPLELYVYITLTNNYLVFFIYQLIILWTISINWHR